MTPQENLDFARAAMRDFDRAAAGFSGQDKAETLALQRAQAHALLGILELLGQRIPDPRAEARWVPDGEWSKRQRTCL